MPHPHLDLVEWLARRGGVAHTSTLRSAGYTSHRVRIGLAAGDFAWVRRSWLATPTADPELARAASLAGRLTCLTSARRQGLWVPDGADGLHIAVPRTSSRLAAHDVHLHWAAAPAPSGAFSLEDPILNVLFHVARCLGEADAAAVWESAIRLRRVDAGVLASVRWRSTSASRLARSASSLSDSGIETAFVRLMRGLGVAVAQQVVIDGHPVDGLIGERLVVQLDGFAHHQARQRRRDLRADARLVLRGYVVLRFDYQQVLFDPQFVTETIATAMAQGHHHPR
ncbi:DUF559 domain-containing protein [Microbacterium radiodurans]|uniref:DUF559 domain-containing protein n=1 Tax=Microbacterium radiodurans TaxID=661398 RepID=A0A5J5IS73_9MICO|nr:DUF559 domain-containing protein [Microbacterium radiodurans]KAA9087315.1 DUF559 domain-containing protein [Microbacterium radiodurans]